MYENTTRIADFYDLASKIKMPSLQVMVSFMFSGSVACMPKPWRRYALLQNQSETVRSEPEVRNELRVSPQLLNRTFNAAYGCVFPNQFQ